MSYCIFLQYRAALPYWEPLSMRSLGLTHWSTTLQTFNRHTQPRVTVTSGEEQVCLEVNPRWATSNTDVESNLTLCPLNAIKRNNSSFHQPLHQEYIQNYRSSRNCVSIWPTCINPHHRAFQINAHRSHHEHTHTPPAAGAP